MGNVLTIAVRMGIMAALNTSVGAAIAGPILAAFGLGGLGIADGSLAALLHSTQGNAAADNVFAALQAAGMGG
ncbi:hypothetical protein F4781DRAFT_430486 [Annulohypoxylon bovei var. microspora]|nr:hypothetical protein F4781DRAFT_430486 [Annulohypoxylon bovei var. microspora]